MTLTSVPTPAELSNLLSAGGAPTAVPGAHYYYLVSGLNFQPTDSALTTTSYVSGGCISSTGAVAAQLLLPNGATVLGIRNFYNRTNANSNTIYLTRYNASSGAFETLATASATSSSGYGTDLSASITHVVDDLTWGYQAIWNNGGGGSANLLCGARVYYTMPPTGTYTPVAPCRLINTRNISAPNLTTTPRNFQIAGAGCGVPTGATAVTANLTVAEGTAAGYLAIWQQGTTWPGNSTLNFLAGQSVANVLVRMTVGPSGPRGVPAPSESELATNVPANVRPSRPPSPA